MIRKLLFLIILACPNFSISQVIYQEITSTKLGEDRKLKIQLPRNYEKNKDKSYPVFIVLDGDYLFEPVAGNVDYYSYWEDIPEMIVVGINQSTSRAADSFYDEQRFLPAKTGAAFFEFLGMELMPYLDKTYRTEPFRVIIGHDLTSNFLNYYLLKENPLFQGYINLSPDLSPEMANRITTSLSNTVNPTWYYLSTSSEDIPDLKNRILTFDSQLKIINNENLHYNFDNFEDATHYTLVGKAIPNAIEQIFKVYRPITIADYNRVLLQTSVSSYDYLIEKYDNINKLFGIDMKIRVNDFMAVYNAMEKTRKWEELKNLAKLAEKHYPNTMLASYYDARYDEETGDLKGAMKNYLKAYGQEAISYLTVDFMLDKAETIKRANGY